MNRMVSLRPARFDELGLRRALASRMLPLLVAAMAFLAALALAGWFGAAAVAGRWQHGAGASLTLQVPQPAQPALRRDQTRLAAVLGILNATPGIASAHALSDRELSDLLRPWIGAAADRLAIAIPAVIAVQLADSNPDLEPMQRRIAETAPGTFVEDHGVWTGRIVVLARSLQACAGIALLLVAAVAASVIALATWAGLSTRRETIEIVHGLGATDGYIAGRFAARATLHAALGAAAGALAALPVLLTLAQFAAPLAGQPALPAETLQDALQTLPAALWLALPCLPLGAAAIGFVTAQGAVRNWLRSLP